MFIRLMPFLFTYIAGALTVIVIIRYQQKIGIYLLKKKKCRDSTIANPVEISEEAIENPSYKKPADANTINIGNLAVLSDVISRSSILANQIQLFTKQIADSTEIVISKFAELLLSINSSIKGTTDVVDTVHLKMSSCVSQNDIHDNECSSLITIKERYEVMINEVMHQFDLTIQRKKEDVAKLDHIRESAYKIKPFANEISSIASTTKLLSLNAFIEAARAREHGKAFGVVALEVRHLADKSRASAEDMNASLGSVIEFIDDSIQELKDAIDVESRFTQSTMILIQDVVMSLVESFISISEAVEKTIGDSSNFRDEVNTIVFNLQFEDICHQMSSRIVNILDSIKHDIEHFMNVDDTVKDISDSNTYCINNIAVAPVMPTNRVDGEDADDDVTFFD